MGNDMVNADLGEMCLLFDIQAVKLLIDLFHDMITKKREAWYMYKIRFEAKEWKKMTITFNTKLEKLGGCKTDYEDNQVRTKIYCMKRGDVQIW